MKKQFSCHYQCASEVSMNHIDISKYTESQNMFLLTIEQCNSPSSIGYFSKIRAVRISLMSAKIGVLYICNLPSFQ